jgi:hypothetical protein
MNNLTLSTTLTTISVSTETDIVGTVTTTADEIMDKRSEATPAALAAYPENAISSGCSRAAKLPGTQTMAETITLTSIETIATTIVTTAYTTEASIATEAATSTVTALAPVYTGTPCGTQPYGALWEDSNARYKLYCDGYYFSGYPFSQATTSGMADCLKSCEAQGCTAVTVHGGMCYLYTDDARLGSSKGYSAAVLVQ